MADERCPYAHGPLIVQGPEIDGKQGIDKQGRIYKSIMFCPECKGHFAVTGIREIVEVQVL